MALLDWHTSKRVIPCGGRTMVMAIINVTPDSFSDGGVYNKPDEVLSRVEEVLAEGADILDIGGESTRPESKQIESDEEISRVIPVIEAIARRFDVPISVDTSKSEVARAALNAGAEIINDISGLRFDPLLAKIAAGFGSGLILMHSRGEFSEMHKQPPVEDIFNEVRVSLEKSVTTANEHGVKNENIVVDPGIGFGKTASQNLELLANLDKIVEEFSEHPVLAGASRKSFISKLSGDADVSKRLGGSIAAAALAVLMGASIVRVHDVAETVQAVRLLDELKILRSESI
jgi:dihydropteroate synthase